jgi:type II restriction/modification system DNA methylase subunit YeeA
MTEHDAALYQAPFEYVRKYVKPLRESNRDRQRRRSWWRHGRAGTELRAASAGLTRVIATPRVARHRFFVWLPAHTVPDSRVFVFARADDFYFGSLSSCVHEAWALATASRHGVGNDPTYNNTTCFETFPLPHASPEQQAAIADTARKLDRLRQTWLNPPEDSIAPSELKRRTLTNLYNQRPTWLVNAHRKLDEAVFAAYGWPEPADKLSDSEIVSRLLRLNLEREPA